LDHIGIGVIVADISRKVLAENLVEEFGGRFYQQKLEAYFSSES
jgi:hypothetical protein